MAQTPIDFNKISEFAAEWQYILETLLEASRADEEVTLDPSQVKTLVQGITMLGKGRQGR